MLVELSSHLILNTHSGTSVQYVMLLCPNVSCRGAIWSLSALKVCNGDFLNSGWLGCDGRPYPVTFVDGNALGNSWEACLTGIDRWTCLFLPCLHAIDPRLQPNSYRRGFLVFRCLALSPLFCLSSHLFSSLKHADFQLPLPRLNISTKQKQVSFRSTGE